MKKTFELFGSDDQVWCFQAPEALSEKALSKTIKALDTFVETWESHGKAVSARYQIIADQLIIVHADAKSDVSGCSKDSLFQVMQNLLYKTGLNFLDRDHILWIQDDSIQTAHKDKFRQLVQSSELTPETLVIDSTITQAQDLIDHSYIKPLSESWHGQAFL